MTTGQTAQIVIDDRFFEVGAAQSSRYSRLWTIAKETMQNSQDAHAKVIEFDVNDDWVIVRDDGPSMAATGGDDTRCRLRQSQRGLHCGRE